MKKIILFFLVAYASYAFSSNTIIAVVNKTPITLNSIQINLKDSDSKEEQILIIKNYIDNIMQVQKASELDLNPNHNQACMK